MTLPLIELNLGGHVLAKSLCQPNCWYKSVQPKEVQKHTCSLTQCKYKLKKPNVYATILRTGDGKFSEVQAQKVFCIFLQFWIFWRVFKRPPRFLFKTYKKHKHALWWASVHHLQSTVWKAFLLSDEIYCKLNFIEVARFFYFLVLLKKNLQK